MDMQIHHIGIVVDDIDQAKKVYENIFGWEITLRKMVDEFNAECAFIPAGNIYLELVKPTANDGLKRFLEKHGSGSLHHICYIVDDMKQGWNYFQEKGVRSVTGEPRSIPTFGKAMFFHPKDTGKVLVEFVTEAACPLPFK